MLFKKLYFILFASLLAFSVSGCSNSEDDTPPQATDEQRAITLDVIDAVSEAFNSEYSGMKSPAYKGSGTFDWSGTGYTATGSWTYADAGDHYPIHLQVTFTWDGYTSGEVVIVSGTSDIVFDATSDYAFTMTYSGDLEITYQGTPYSFSWDLTLTYDYPNYTVSGTASIDGDTFSISGSGK